MPILAPFFFVTALLYGAVGFGGGSTYSALLVLAGSDYRAVPVVSLACNILVVAMGSWRFARSGHVDWGRIWPLLALSVPLAWLGGRLVVAEALFVGLLAVSLFCAALLMLWPPRWQREGPPRFASSWAYAMAGGGLGFLAGLVGIGGGIFLAPLLYLLRWGTPRAIAGTSAVFILANSIAGLAGQLAKDRAAAGAFLAAHWPLFPAVLAGGLIGATLGSRRLDPKYVRILTALLILYIAVRLGIRFYGETLGAGA
ncbi:MAG: sulfite exporter TauE/SafE family protein [Alphaproteobacteria bacterium]|nr:sulfite exporter TauE/SafE family protein [Alphaproteobacteria bacterium]